jgi:LmbE family N-acetylglucosaminyl deacetylase
MPAPLRLLAILAHPDDETLGMGGTSALRGEGIETFLVTATRGQAGRFRELKRGEPGHPGHEALGAIRKQELHAAARVLGVREVVLLDHMDGQLDAADPVRTAAEIATHVRRLKPHVVVTFAQDGGYGHPDHIAICQLAASALAGAADACAKGHRRRAARVREVLPDGVAALALGGVPGGVQEADLDRRRRRAPGESVARLGAERAHRHARVLAPCGRRCSATTRRRRTTERSRRRPRTTRPVGWGTFYRVFSTVNGGRAQESDLFAGLRVTSS